MEDKYLTVVEEHVERLGEMAKNINEVSLEGCRPDVVNMLAMNKVLRGE